MDYQSLVDQFQRIKLIGGG